MRCPECGSEELIKSGRRWLKENGVRVRKQQYQCKGCGRNTLYPLDAQPVGEKVES